MTPGTIATAPSLEEARRLSDSYNVIPVFHQFLDDTETPVSAFLKLRQGAGCFLLESAEQGQRVGRYSFLGIKAWESIRLTGGIVTIRRGGVDTVHDMSAYGADPFGFMAQHMARYRVPPLQGLPPLVGGAVGYFGYDCIRYVERLPQAPPDDLGLPEMAFLLTDVVVVFDHLLHTITLLTNIFRDGETQLETDYASAVGRLAEVKARLRGPVPVAERNADGGAEWWPPRGSAGEAADVVGPGASIRSSFERDAFLKAVERIREDIYAGDAPQD